MERGGGKMMNNKIEAKSHTHFSNIPEEIVVLILPKLPVKSLLRFKCVSKSWRYLISDPKFSLSIQRSLVIFVPEYYRSSFSIHVMDDEGSVMDLPKPEPISHRKLPLEMRIRGSCNGLLLVSVLEDLFLWNPSTRSCNRVLAHYCFHPRYCWDAVFSGLCYDSSTDDYKVLMAIFTYSVTYNYYVDDDDDDDIVIVGSLRHKTWTEIDFPYNIYRVVAGPVVNDRLHWVVTNSRRDGSLSSLCSIVYFDPQTNGFVEMPMPQLNGWNEIVVLGLGVLDGCLSMAISRHRGMDFDSCITDLEVLVMKKYGDNTSWSSLYFVPNVLGLDTIYYLTPLCSTKNGDVLLHSFVHHGEDSILEQYLGSDFQVQDMDAAMFVESLASPSSYNWEDEEYMEIFLSGMTRQKKCGQRIGVEDLIGAERYSRVLGKYILFLVDNG